MPTLQQENVCGICRRVSICKYKEIKNCSYVLVVLVLIWVYLQFILKGFCSDLVHVSSTQCRISHSVIIMEKRVHMLVCLVYIWNMNQHQTYKF